jgi:hypothetical protein
VFWTAWTLQRLTEPISDLVFVLLDVLKTSHSNDHTNVFTPRMCNTFKMFLNSGCNASSNLVLSHAADLPQSATKFHNNFVGCGIDAWQILPEMRNKLTSEIRARLSRTQKSQIDRLAALKGRSTAEILRDAVDAFLKRQPSKAHGEPLDPAQQPADNLSADLKACSEGNTGGAPEYIQPASSKLIRMSALGFLLAGLTRILS